MVDEKSRHANTHSDGEACLDPSRNGSTGQDGGDAIDEADLRGQRGRDEDEGPTRGSTKRQATTKIHCASGHGAPELDRTAPGKSLGTLLTN